MYPKKLWTSITIILLLAACNPAPRVTPSVVPSAVATALPSQTATGKQPPETSPTGEQKLLPTTQPGHKAPYPDAPLCPDSGETHDNSLFHTLWDDIRGCHYDHEHGQNPFTQEVAAAFPGFDLQTLIGGVGVGHTNPSSPMENTHKHGGFKWNVQLVHPENCIGFEGATYGASASVIQYHAFGDEAIELEARVHSTVALVRQCSADNPTDYGYVYVVQFQDYGQRVIPYQGTVVAYPDQPGPAYDPQRGPYLTADCVDNVPPTVIQCRDSLEQVLSKHSNVVSNWSSKPTGKGGDSVHGSRLFTLLFRVRDSYRLFDWNDQVHPFTWQWLCSSDGGANYNAVGCRYNNSTTQVHEISGEIPKEWDNLAGFDTNPTVGRITAEGYVTHFGELNIACAAPSSDADCFPIKLVHAFVGTWGSVLVYTNERKGTNIVPSAPSRNIFFCGGQLCTEGDPGAAPSGWIGQNN
jgi:hypothetical protein